MPAEWLALLERSIAGSAEAKEKEEEELEQAAFEMAQALVTYFMDAGDLEAAEPFRRTFSYWQRLRDQDLLLRSQAVIDAATPLTTGANAATIAENYGISAARVATLVSERNGYDAVVSAPAAARAGRKAYTAQMREKFRPVTAKFRDLDRLVPQFRSRPGGEAFVEGWFAARQVINAGSGPGTGGSGGGAPAAPTGVTAEPGDPGQVNVSWQASAGATLYTVRVFWPGGSPEESTFDSETTSRSLTDFPPGASLEIAVRASNAAGTSALSAMVPVTVP